VGDNVFALGNPLGYLYGSLTEGIVSAPTRSVDMEGTAMTLIQISAPINLGNSGGALLNERGQVVGITSAKMTGKRDNVDVEGVGLALPISEIRNEINSIIQNGRVITPRIGIMCYEAVFDDVGGVLVDAVTEGDPAEKAGIHPGDFITHINGIPFSTLDELKEELYKVGVDGEAVLSVMRGTEKLELTVILAG
jgi:serine protease Do